MCTPSTSRYAAGFSSVRGYIARKQLSLSSSLLAVHSREHGQMMDEQAGNVK